MHLVLAARREQLLTQLAAELHQAHGTKTEIIIADVSVPQDRPRLLEEVRRRGLTIELLVNNAGFGLIAEIEKTDVARVLEMIQVNIAALNELTYLVLPEMMGRGPGGLNNVASVAAHQPVGDVAVYAATKAYVLHFSEALWAEARDRGVTITTLCPGTTRTDFFEVSGIPGWLERHSAADVKPVVRTALNALEKRRQYVIPGWKDYILSLLVRLATRATVVKESMKYFRLKT